jgi:hypothetical protein
VPSICILIVYILLNKNVQDNFGEGPAVQDILRRVGGGGSTRKAEKTALSYSVFKEKICFHDKQ